MTYAENILAVYRRAIADDIREGMEWYAYAHGIAQEANDVSTGAGILSALSPRMPWYRNVILARQAFVKPLTGGALGNSIAAANRIQAGENPLDVLGGLKTRAFYGNILDPADSEIVTVDTHAIKIAGINRDSVGKRLYSDIADGYREAAMQFNILPQQIQAITWITWRREKGIK